MSKREEPGTQHEHAEPDDHEGEPPGRHVDQGEESAEEHHRAAQVADEDQQHHRGAPDDEQRAEVLERWQDEAEDVAGAHDEHLAMLVQVARQEDDDADLGQLGRLEGDRPEVDREVGVVDRVAEKARED
jgi:hypothetical protein